MAKQSLVCQPQNGFGRIAPAFNEQVICGGMLIGGNIAPHLFKGLYSPQHMLCSKLTKLSRNVFLPCCLSFCHSHLALLRLDIAPIYH
ncbi:hypothetical protein CVS42_11235 [Aeromonas veronii]|nr:hypothetical protein CVS42_11235 [Aeromonas veronii]